MVYISLGVLGFIAFMVFDIASLNQKCCSKYFFGAIGLLLIVISTVMIIQMKENIVLNNWIRMGSYILALIFLSLLIYSVFVEVGKNTYEYNAKPCLVTDGTYSLVRHPGVLWFVFTYLFAALAFESQMLLYAGLVWSVVDGLYTYIQEKYVLYKLFGNYTEYKKTTPMFIPNITSMKKFIASENWRKR
jgi:protein-S-isoprenylcysteine O-methyltransferase Ste14